jgi:hypothetical protein
MEITSMCETVVDGFLGEEVKNVQTIAFLLNVRS